MSKKQVIDKYPHFHCPNGCEKPQPFEFEDRVICGRCLYENNIIIECFLCTPETCNEENNVK